MALAWPQVAGHLVAAVCALAQGCAGHAALYTQCTYGYAPTAGATLPLGAGATHMAPGVYRRDAWGRNPKTTHVAGWLRINMYNKIVQGIKNMNTVRAKMDVPGMAAIGVRRL